MHFSILTRCSILTPITIAFLAFASQDPNLALAQHSAAGTPAVPETTHSLHIHLPGLQPQPVAMVSGDFDEDGAADLVVGYSSGHSGTIALLRGNGDALAPRTHESWLKATRHQYVDPFLQDSKPITATSVPSLMLEADVNGDGHLDLVYATKGEPILRVLLGTGHGTFLSKPVSYSLPGGITALASYRPAFPAHSDALIVGYESAQGAHLGILTSTAAGLQLNAKYPLPGTPTALAVAHLDSDLIPDTAILAGGELLVLHGANALAGKGRLETLPISGVEAIATGSFLFDRHGNAQISALTSGSEAIILAHQGFDPRPFTPEQSSQARHNATTHNTQALTLAQQAGINADAPWVEVERHSDPALRSSGPDAPVMLHTRMSGGGQDDLVVLNPSNQQRVMISHSPRLPDSAISAGNNLSQTNISRVAVKPLKAGGIVAAISTRVSADGRPGLVILNANNPSPDISVPGVVNTFYVNVTSDNSGATTDAPDGTRCSFGAIEPCTLRDAITFVNLDAAGNIGGGSSDTISLPSGTYPLSWQAGTTDANANYVTHLELLGPVTILGDPSGTIIDGGSNDTIFTINPGQYGSFNPSGDSYVFDATLEDLTLQNGLNQNNPSASTTGLFNNVGGAINWDAFGTGNLTLSNCTVSSNKITWGGGGGIWAYNSAGSGAGVLTITNSSISNNSTSEQGGGMYIGSAPVEVSASGSTFSGNTANISLNPSDPEGAAGLGQGAGLWFAGRLSSSGTPGSTLTGMTISGNAADGHGGGIYTNAGITLTNSTVTTNTSTHWGGGVFTEVATPETGTTLTGNNFNANSATTAGGAVLVGTEPAANGNTLVMHLNRVYGNTSGGVSGLAVGVPSVSGAGGANATENWWGCNLGPLDSADKCDQATLYDSGTGNMTVTPYAVWSFNSAPSTISLGSGIGLSVALNTDSSSASIAGAFPGVSGLPYSYTLLGVTGNITGTVNTLSSLGTDTATLTPTSGGSGTIAATFDGETITDSFTVLLVPSIQTVATSAQNTPVGTNVTFSTAVSGSGPTPTGTVTFFTSGTPIGTQTLSGGAASITTNSLAIGTYAITASYSGDSVYATGTTSASTTQYITNQATETLTVQPNPSAVGQTVTLTAKVLNTGGFVPTGSVRFFSDFAPLALVPLDVSGTATFQTNSLKLGVHSIAASYTGDANYSLVNAAPVTATVTQWTPTVQASSLQQTAGFQSNVTLVATVSGGSGTPTGQVTFYTNNVFVGSSTLTGGTTSITVNSLPAGIDSITVHYLGDTTYLPGISPDYTQIITKLVTALTLNPVPSPVSVGSSLTLTANLSTALVGFPPTGTVNFYDHYAFLGSGTVSGGVASFATSALPAGQHSFTAEYSGDASYSAAVAVATDTVAKIATTVTLTGSGSPATLGQSVTFTATVNLGAGTANPTGTINFYSGNTLLGTGALSGNQATFTTSTLPHGVHTISAQFWGDTTYLGSRSNNLTEIVQ